MQQSDQIKVQVFCPEKSADKVRNAIGKAGGGKIGEYEYCSFITKGKGYFLPSQNTNPTVGTVGKMAEVEEVKIEFLCNKDKIKQVVEAVKKVHPYEKVVFDIFPLLELEDN